MFRNAVYVRLVLLMLVLSAAAVFLGSEPWGPGLSLGFWRPFESLAWAALELQRRSPCSVMPCT